MRGYEEIYYLKSGQNEVEGKPDEVLINELICLIPDLIIKIVKLKQLLLFHHGYIRHGETYSLSNNNKKK